MEAVPWEGSDRVSIFISLLRLVTVIDYVYLPMFLFFALLDLSPALPYSAREKRQGHKLVDIRPAQTCTRCQKGRGTPPPGRRWT